MTASVSVSLSFEQTRIWIVESLTRRTSVYNIPLFMQLRGRLDKRALVVAIDALCRRHEILRARFSEDDDGEVRQHFDAPHAQLDVRCEPADEGTLIAEGTRVFDLFAGPLVRFTLFPIDEQTHVFAFVLHHIIADGWSLNILIRELAVFYETAKKSRDDAAHVVAQAQLPALQATYRDYIARQQAREHDAEYSEELAYWRDVLRGAPTSTALPVDYPRPAVQQLLGNSIEIALDASVIARLDAKSRCFGATTYMLLFAAYALLLRKWTGQGDMLIGMPIADRASDDVQDLVGFCLNTLPIRVTFADEDESFEEFLGRVGESLMKAYGYQHVSFDRLLDLANTPRSLDRQPLLQVYLNSFTFDPTGTFGDLVREEIVIPYQRTKVDLTVSYVAMPSGGRLVVDYDRKLFREQTVQRFAGHLQALLERIVSDGDATVRALLGTIPQADERSFILRCGRVGASQSQEEALKPLHERIFEHADGHPDTIAITDEHEALSYAQLQERSRRIACVLREQARAQGKALGRDVVVAISIPSSVNAVAAAIGVLLTGSAFAFVGDHTALDGMVLTQEHMGAQMLDRNPDVAQSAPTVHPKQLAYLVPSEHEPGAFVEIEHGAAHSLLRAIAEPLEGHSRFACLHDTTTAAFIIETFGALTSGGFVAIAGDQTRDVAGNEPLESFVRKGGLQCVFIAADLFRERVLHASTRGRSGLASLRKLVVYGKANLPDTRDVAQWLGEHHGEGSLDVYLAYGSAETGIATTLHRVDPENDAARPIAGRPLAAMQTLLVDGTNQIVPLGVTGTLLIGGSAIGRGYWNRSDLTQQRFTPHPFIAHSRVFRTSDCARMLATGDIEFASQKETAAPPEAPASAALASAVSSRLSSVEANLASIWAEVLGIDSAAITAADNFFDLGGNSLQATRLAARIRAEFSQKVPLTAIFKAATLAELAADIAKRIVASPSNDVVQLGPGESRRESVIVFVHELWGSVEVYEPIVRALSSSAFAWALKPIGAGSLEIETYARVALERLQSAGLQRPFTFVGWSYGGLVAYEMARQSIEEGSKAVLLDAILQNGAHAMGEWAMLAISLCGDDAVTRSADFSTLSDDAKSARLFAQCRTSTSALGAQWIERHATAEAFFASLRPVRERYAATRRYVPAPTTAATLVVGCLGNPDHAREENAIRWRALAHADFDAQWIDTTHPQLLAKKHSDGLAKQIDRWHARSTVAV